MTDKWHLITDICHDLIPERKCKNRFNPFVPPRCIQLDSIKEIDNKVILLMDTCVYKHPDRYS